MNCKIPFTKEILFEKKVSEITSISLEHEINVGDNFLKGNFIVSGDYKSHEVSVNKDPFSYILPFEIDLASDIDPNTVEFMIDDFTYEIVDNSKLKVNIDFNVIASKKEEQEKIETEEETIFKDPEEVFTPLEKRELSREAEEKQDDLSIEASEEKEEVVEEKEEEERIKPLDIIKEVILPDNKENIEINNTEIVQEKKEVTTEDTIINSVKSTDDDYTTYHIHMVSDGETVETICSMYGTNINILADYNDLNEITEKDKLIIPEQDEQ